MTVHGVAARVPVAADHLVEMLVRGWWPDAACAARHPGMDWERFVASCDRRGAGAPVQRALAVLAAVVATDFVPPGVPARLARRSSWARRRTAAVLGWRRGASCAGA